MSEDFDPDLPLTSQGVADQYIRWCDDRLWELMGSDATADFALGRRVAGLLWVLSSSQLDVAPVDGQPPSPIAMLNLAKISLMARQYERGRTPDIRQMWGVRAAVDCFEGEGEYADLMLAVVKMASSAAILVAGYPLDCTDQLAPDVWALLLTAAEMIKGTYDEGERIAEDFVVRVNHKVVDVARWQWASRVATTFGGPPPSQN